MLLDEEKSNSQRLQDQVNITQKLTYSQKLSSKFPTPAGECHEQQDASPEARQRGSGGRAGDEQVSPKAAAIPAGGR